MEQYVIRTIHKSGRVSYWGLLNGQERWVSTVKDAMRMEWEEAKMLLIRFERTVTDGRIEAVWA